MYKRALFLLAASSAVAIAACSDDDPIREVPKVTFKATMLGANERLTPITTPGTGTFTGILDTVTNVFTYTMTYTGLTSNVNNGHIHGPSTVDVTGGVILNFNTLAGATFNMGVTQGAGSGTVTLNAANQISANVNGDSLKKLMFNGLAYVNIHTVNNTGGEIRGQLVKQ